MTIQAGSSDLNWGARPSTGSWAARGPPAGPAGGQHAPAPTLPVLLVSRCRVAALRASWVRPDSEPGRSASPCQCGPACGARGSVRGHAARARSAGMGPGWGCAAAVDPAQRLRGREGAPAGIDHRRAPAQGHWQLEGIRPRSRAVRRPSERGSSVLRRDGASMAQVRAG
jgi:hypothetical protein